MSVGVTVASSIFTDCLRSSFTSGQSVSKEEFASKLQNFMNLQGVDVRASTVIEMFVAEGLLNIEGSNIYAPREIAMGASSGGKFISGNNSTSETKTTKIVASGNAQIVGTGNTAIVQDSGGSIRFFVGKKESK